MSQQNALKQHTSDYRRKLLLSILRIAAPVIAIICGISLLLLSFSSRQTALKSQSAAAEKISSDLSHIITNTETLSQDMIFNNEEARTGLWNFVAAHFSMINQVEGDTYTDEPLAFLLEDASIKEVISPYYMGRIVDFVSFIEKYPFKPSVLDREWKFRLVDPIMECNQGNFHLIISRDGHGQVMRIMEPCEDTINIQTMTTMLMGYKRPEYLAKIGRIQAAEWTIDMLEDAIEQQTPYISDYF